MSTKEQNWSLIERLNKIPVTKEEILDLVREVDKLGELDCGRDFFGVTPTIFYLYPGDWDKTQAILLRMQALEMLIQEEGIPGWTKSEGPDGGIATQEPVFAATAVQPLIEKTYGAIGFDRESFLLKVLELGKLDTPG